MTDAKELFRTLLDRLNQARVNQDYSKIDLAHLTNKALRGMSNIDRDALYAPKFNLIREIADVLRFKVQLAGVLDQALSQEFANLLQNPLTTSEILSRAIFVNAEHDQTIIRNTGSYVGLHELVAIQQLSLKNGLLFLKKAGLLEEFLTTFLTKDDLEPNTNNDDDGLNISSIARYVQRKRTESKLSLCEVAVKMEVTIDTIRRLEQVKFSRFRTLLDFILMVEDNIDRTIFIKKIPSISSMCDKLQQLLNYRQITRGELTAKMNKSILYSKSKRVVELFDHDDFSFLTLVEAICALGYDDELTNLFLVPEEEQSHTLKIPVSEIVDVSLHSTILIRFAALYKLKRERLCKSVNEISEETGISIVSIKKFEQSGEINIHDFFKITSLYKFTSVFSLLVPDQDEHSAFEISESLFRVFKVAKKKHKFTLVKLAEHCALSDSTVFLFISKKQGTLQTFIQLAIALDYSQIISTIVQHIANAVTQGAEDLQTTIMGSAPDRFGENEELSYPMLIAAYKEFRQSLGFTQNQVHEKVDGLHKDLYLNFERRGVLPVQDWILINIALGLEEKMVKVFSSPDIERLSLSMSRQHLLLLLIGHKIVVARERMLLTRIDLSNGIGLEEDVVAKMEDGEGGKVSTMFKIFNALNMAHDLFAIIGKKDASQILPSFDLDAKSLRSCSIAILLTDQLKKIRRERQISLEELSKLTGVTASKIKRFETSSRINLSGYIAIARILCPLLVQWVLAPVGLSIHEDCYKVLGSKCKQHRLYRDIKLNEITRVTGIHLSELIRFEKSSIIQLDSLLRLYMTLFDEFKFQTQIVDVLPQLSRKATA